MLSNQVESLPLRVGVIITIKMGEVWYKILKSTYGCYGYGVTVCDGLVYHVY